MVVILCLILQFLNVKLKNMKALDCVYQPDEWVASFHFQIMKTQIKDLYWWLTRTNNYFDVNFYTISFF
jgi:hypothetical protein